MTGRGWVRVAAGLLAVAGLVLGAAVERPTAAPAAGPRASTSSVTSAAYVCSSASGTPTAPAVITVASLTRLLDGAGPPATVTTRPLAGGHPKTVKLPRSAVTRVRSTAVARAVLVSARGRGAGAVAADQRRLIPSGRQRALVSTPCLPPGTDWWLTGADGRVGYNDLLVLANPGTTTANVTVSAWAATGRLHPPRLQSFTLGPGTSTALTVSAYAPDAGLVTLHVHANSGRVTADVLDRRVSGVRASGSDWIPPTRPPSRNVVLPGVPAGGGQRLLVLTDPGTTDATVSVRLVTTGGDFAPAGHPTVLVRAGHSVAVDLTTSLGQAAAAMVLRSDQPVTAAAVSQTPTSLRHGFPDIQWHPAGVPVDGPAVLPDDTPPFGGNVRVYLTAPQGAGRMQLTSVDGHRITVAVPAGRTVIVDPVARLGARATGPLLLQPAGGVPLYVSRTLYFAGAHGPLTTAEQPTVLPAPVRLPAATADLRPGLR